MIIVNFRSCFHASIALVVSFSAHAQSLPSAEQMQTLKPTPGRRLQIYDRLFSTTARLADENHRRYSNPEVLADIDQRLERVRLSGNPQDVFTINEQRQLEKNLTELRTLESEFFQKWYLKKPMDAAIQFQKWMTKRSSPIPNGNEKEALISHWQLTSQKNPLYQSWYEGLPSHLTKVDGPTSWGELLVRFSNDAAFRKDWVDRHPETLSQINRLSQIWAWEDSSVRSVEVIHPNSVQEHWVLHRMERPHVPNRFHAILENNFEGLLKIEYSPTLFFNRLSRITKESESIIYHLESVEKGRTMEPALKSNQHGTDKQTFRGAEFLRKSKSDEFLQRDYIQKGSLNLFLGLRTMQLNQIQELMKIDPALILSVGQLGFSVTGGMAQTVSNRTDTPQEQLLKATATLIDFIEFAQTQDVKSWFDRNTRHVLRTILGGVGAGGAQALAEPTSQEKKSLAQKIGAAPGMVSCHKVWH